MVERLILAVPWGCLMFVIVVFPDHTHLLIFICFVLQPHIGPRKGVWWVWIKGLLTDTWLQKHALLFLTSQWSVALMIALPLISIISLLYFSTVFDQLLS